MKIDLKQEQGSPAKEVHMMSFAELNAVLAQETKAIRQLPFDENGWVNSSFAINKYKELVKIEITELNNKFYLATSELKGLARILPEIEKIIFDYHMLRGLEDNPRKAVLSMKNRAGFESAKMQFIKLRTQDSRFTIEEILAAESDFFNGIVIKAKNDVPKIQNNLIAFQAKILELTQSCILKFNQLESCFGTKDNLNEITALNELIDQINQNIQCIDLNNFRTSYEELLELVQIIQDYVSELVKVWESGDWVLPRNSKSNIGAIIASEINKELSNRVENEKAEQQTSISNAFLEDQLTLKTYMLIARALDAGICYSKNNPSHLANLSKIERSYREHAYQNVETQIAEIFNIFNVTDIIVKIRTLAAEDLNFDHLESFIKIKYVEPQNSLRELLRKYNLNDELANNFVNNYNNTDLEQLVYCLKFNKKILPVFINKLELYPELIELNIVELGEYLNLLKKIDGYLEKIDDSTKAYLIPNANTYESIQNLKNYAEILGNLDLDPSKLIKLKNEKDFLKIKSLISDNFSKFNDNEVLLTYELLLFAYQIDSADLNSPKKVSDLIKTINAHGDYHAQGLEQFTESLLNLLKELEVSEILIKTTNARKVKDCKFKLNLQHDLIIKIKSELSIVSQELSQNNDIPESSEANENSAFLLKIHPPEKQNLETALEQIMQLFVVINEHDYLLAKAKDYFTLKFHIYEVSNKFLDYARNDRLLKKNQGIKKSFEDFCLHYIQRNTILLAKQGPVKTSVMLKCIQACFDTYAIQNNLHSAYQVIDIIMKLQTNLIKLAEARPQIKREDYIILSKFDKNLREDLYEERELNDRKLVAGITRLREIFTNEKEFNQLIDEITVLSKLLSPEKNDQELCPPELIFEEPVSLEITFND